MSIGKRRVEGTFYDRAARRTLVPFLECLVLCHISLSLSTLIFKNHFHLVGLIMETFFLVNIIKVFSVYHEICLKFIVYFIEKVGHFQTYLVV